jgi:3,4-dihydroxyphenylacetate 2,3-dioxygenase
MSLDLVLLSPHVPSICFEDKAPKYQAPLIQGLHHQKEEINKVKAEVVVIISCHFPATFHHYVDATPRHKGLLTAVEHPDMIADVPYDYPGDETLSLQLEQEGKKVGIPVIAFNDSNYDFDYGTLVPLRYLVPKEDIAVIDLSVSLGASLQETFQWGQIIGKVLRESGKRTVFVSSGALSHNLIRGREKMPTLSEQSLDEQFVAYLLEGNFTSAFEMLPQYSKIAGVESGGRHLAAMLGVLGSDKYDTSYLGYAQSSGSGNASFTFVPKVGG